MIKNYIKIAWRNLVKNRIYSGINILGLALGMTIAILIGLWIWDEISFNKNFKDHDRIVSVIQNSSNGIDKNTVLTISIPVATELRSKYGPDFEKVALYFQTTDRIFTFGETKIIESGLYAEPDFAKILSLDLLNGSLKDFPDPSSILINQTLASTLFGKTDPIDKTIKIDNKNTYKVIGVYKDFAANTDFNDQKFILSWSSLLSDQPWVKVAYDEWNNNSFQIIAKIAKNTTFEHSSKKVKNLLVDKPNRFDKPEVILHPLSKWHLYNEFKDGKNTGGNIQFVWMFGIIGVFVCLLACINFMNLTTARSQKRAKEVGIRKTVGSSRKSIIIQFLSESVLMTVIASLSSIFLVWLSLPYFNALASKAIIFPWSNPAFWFGVILFTAFTGLLSGSYPALYLSSFKPIKVLKGTFKVGALAEIPRKVLVVFQFTVSLSLIVGTIIIFQQIQHVRDRPRGYDQNGLISIRTNMADLSGKYDVLRDELIRSGAAENMAEATNTATGVNNHLIGFDWSGKDPNINVSMSVSWVTYDFGKTVGWQFEEGRDFSRDFATDTSAIILNEAAWKHMALKNPIGETIKFNDVPYKVVGVIKNVIMESPFKSISPTVFMMAFDLNYITVKLNPNMGTAKALRIVEAIFKKHNPSSPFDFSFVDEDYAKKFAAEQKIGSLSSIFAGFAIFISCLGIFGLASFMAEQRTKEIGVRKVLGATIMNLWGLLSKDFLLLVSISFFIAVPISWFIMNNWLNAYQYHAAISAWIYVVTAIFVMLLVLITISFQTIKAAIANPVNSLRNE